MGEIKRLMMLTVSVLPINLVLGPPDFDPWYWDSRYD